jgi:replicative DNA helicase Mcm
MADHIIRGHLIGEKMKEDVAGDGKVLETDYLRESLEPVYKPELLRKYVLYARKKIFPVMTAEAMEAIKSYYITIRKRKEGDKGPIPITPRQLEAIIRLSEARARMRLSKKVTEDDARRAIEIVEYSLKRVATEPGAGGGILDIDIIATGRSRAQWNVVKAIKDSIAQLSETEKDGVEHEKLVADVMKQGIDHAKIEITLKKLIESGEIYQPKHERYRLARER